MLIRRHLPNGRSNHGEIAKPLIFKGLTGKYRECDQRLNYRPLYTIYTDSQSVTRSVLESRTWKQEKTNRNTTAYCVENQRFAEEKTTILNNGSNSVPELCSYLIISVLDALHRKVDSAWESDFLQRKAYYLQKYDTHFEGWLRLLLVINAIPKRTLSILKHHPHTSFSKILQRIADAYLY